MSKIDVNTMPTAKKSNYIKGSRIPVSFLLDYLSEGYSLAEFLSAYPWIKRTSAKKALVNLKQISSNYAF
ncbi:MAG TPA: DUF433 domain-containing protein [Patescibacteria group bacterium]|jgi:uncharacterized protein (DUF433 family)|nr:DUF433 domain-containing protein [Patescibacteria group bacterium]